MEKKLHFTLILLLLFLVTGAVAWRSHEEKKPLIYAESVNREILTVDGAALTLEDLAFYVAYEEKTVQEQAIIYDPDQPVKYWNLYTNGSFIKSEAKQAVLDMAVHDEIFYQLAATEGLELDEEEELYLNNEIYDFCSDLEEGQLEALGVTEEDIEASMQKIAVANKYQSILAQMEGADYEEYNFDGDAYSELLADHEYTETPNIWERISFGSITLNN